MIKKQISMGADWDRRVILDSHCWINEAANSEQGFWESGARDAEQLLSPARPAIKQFARALDFGSGTGRLLPFMAQVFDSVIGIDVSYEALRRSEQLQAGVELVQSSGEGLEVFRDNSFDFVYSFACLGHLPTHVLLKFLVDCKRVLRLGGVASLQLYLGRPQSTVQEDSIAIRAYEEIACLELFRQLQFDLLEQRPLEMPYEAKSLELGLAPYIIVLQKNDENKLYDMAELSSVLRKEIEPNAPEHWAGSRFEYLLAVTRVQGLIKAGEFERAHEMLLFAIERYKEHEPGAWEVLEALKKELERES